MGKLSGENRECHERMRKTQSDLKEQKQGVSQCPGEGFKPPGSHIPWRNQLGTAEYTYAHIYLKKLWQLSGKTWLCNEK